MFLQGSTRLPSHSAPQEMTLERVAGNVCPNVCTCVPTLCVAVDVCAWLHVDVYLCVVTIASVGVCTHVSVGVRICAHVCELLPA